MGDFLVNFFGPLIKITLLIIKNTIKQLLKSVLILLELTAAASTATFRHS